MNLGKMTRRERLQMEDAIKQMKQQILGGVDEEFDTLIELRDYILGLEDLIGEMASAIDEINNVKYMPLNGDITDEEKATFIANLSLITNNKMQSTVDKLYNAIDKITVTLNSESKAEMPTTLHKQSILSVKLYERGRTIDIIYFDLITEDGKKYITAYDRRDGDLVDTEIEVTILNLKKVI